MYRLPWTALFGLPGMASVDILSFRQVPSVTPGIKIRPATMRARLGVLVGDYIFIRLNPKSGPGQPEKKPLGLVMVFVRVPAL
jgi:hypothetical protein